VLYSLTFLFLIRVVGQAIQRWSPRTSLPAFNDFQGSGLPYAALLAAQLVILALMIWAAYRVGAGTLNLSRRESAVLTGFAGLYMAGSVLRIGIGLAVPNAPQWFKAWIPATFHLILAGFVITLALYCRRRLPHSWRAAGAGT
jgi:hypothetical protein